jgi:toxin ParE1/3/4
MKVFWHKDTSADFAAIRHYYDQVDPAIADRLIERIFGLTRHLARFPELGRPGRVRGTLELPVKETKLIVAYGVSADRLTVYAVYHTARKWPQRWLQAAVKAGLDSGQAAELDMHEVIERADAKAADEHEHPEG